MTNQFETSGFPLTHQGGNIYAHQMTVGDRFILITQEEEGFLIGLHSDVDCVGYEEIADESAAVVYAQALAIVCHVRSIIRAMGA